MKILMPLALAALALAVRAPAQVYIRVKPAPGQTEAQARVAAFERRLAAATDGLLARIARDRAARPDVYAELTHYYLETLEAIPAVPGDCAALPLPALRTCGPTSSSSGAGSTSPPTG